MMMAYRDRSSTFNSMISWKILINYRKEGENSTIRKIFKN